MRCFGKRIPLVTDTVTTRVTIESLMANTFFYTKQLWLIMRKWISTRQKEPPESDLTPWSTGVKVYTKAPFVTPWRTIVLADDLNPLVNARIMLNLNQPSKIEDTPGFILKNILVFGGACIWKKCLVAGA